jgi:hypothetical protein
MAAITVYLRFERFVFDKNGNPIISRTIREEPVSDQAVQASGQLDSEVFCKLRESWLGILPEFTLVDANVKLSAMGIFMMGESSAENT